MPDIITAAPRTDAFASHGSLGTSTVSQEELRRTVRETIAGIAERILATTDLSRRERLWPADYMVFATNPMSVAYGAMGTALFLKRALGDLPEEVTDWLLEQRLSIEEYPPGLYSGLSGVAYAFLQLGLVERAEETLELAGRSPLLFTNGSLALGAAGWGWVNLEFCRRLGSRSYLDAAVTAGDYLANSCEAKEDTRFWRGQDDRSIPLGMASGASGIAHYLLQLAIASDDDSFRDLAVKALAFDLSHARTMDQDARWGGSTIENGSRPYWLNGTAGIGSCLARFAAATGDRSYLDWAERASSGATCLFTAGAGQFEGMSGIGEFFLDLHCVTGESRFAELADNIVRGVLCFRADRDNGIAFPGRRLLRLSNDYATGSAGVGLFLSRWLETSPRILHDAYDLTPLRDRVVAP
jgi:hypothetical protein